jgi:hypothetical protein
MNIPGRIEQTRRAAAIFAPQEEIISQNFCYFLLNTNLTPTHCTAQKRIVYRFYFR